MAVDDVQEIEALAELGIAVRQPARPSLPQERGAAAPPTPTLKRRLASGPHRLRAAAAAAVAVCLVCLCAQAADVKKAKEGGFHTVQSLIMQPRKVGTGAGLIQLPACCDAIVWA